MLRKLIVALALALAPSTALAAGSYKHPEGPEGGWSFEGPFGSFDRAALQRGFQVYKEVCSSCHGLKMLTYRNLGEAGGPFQAVAPKRWQDDGVQPVIGEPGHGKYLVNPNDNPWVRAIAADYRVSELDAQSGDMVERPARPSDRFVYPFANEAVGRLANGGAYPPDLSVITKARHYGADYIYNLMLGYKEQPPAGVAPVAQRYYNEYFKGGWIAMPPQLFEGRVTYADGTEATPEQMAYDVTTFLAWASDPKQEQRKQTGFVVLAYLLLLSGLLYIAYRQVWRNESH